MYKKFVFLTVLLLIAIRSSVFAYDFSSVAPSGQTLYYNIVNGNAQVTYEVSSCPSHSNLAGNLIIPASVTFNNVSYSVTSIGLQAFYYCGGLTSVTIPNSVTSIGIFAFYGCFGLTSVIIGDSVTTIDERAFCYCSGLTSITIPNSVTSLGQQAFQDCTGLTSVTFNADSCVSAGSISNSNDRAFYGCSNITNFTFGNNVIIIPDYLCLGLPGMLSVTIPPSVTSIGKSAFANCSGLTSVSIPSSVTSIGDGAFIGCSGLTTITIPSSVTSIGNWAFRGCSGLTTITIPNSVTSIGNDAFYNCTGLTSVTIPDAVTSIGGSAFSGCSGLTSVTIGEGVTSIGSYAFSGCSGLTSITIPDAVTSIGERAFYNCNGLDTVYMKPATAPWLGYYAFDNNATGPVFILNGCSYNSYYNGYGWSGYRSYLCDPIIDINVTVSTNVPERGQATIIPLRNHDVRCDSTVVVEAIANYGYHFDHWSTGSNANPDTIHLVGDTNVTAFFAPNLYSLTVNADEHGTGGGSGTYSYGDTIMIQAFPEEHYHFIRWDDGNRDNPRQVVVTGDLSFTAFFAIDTHMVHVATNDIARGMVEATGTEFVYGTPCTVTATAYTGYTFAGWSNGVNANPYTFAVLSDVELTALFVAEGEAVYTVTVVSADPTMGTASGGGQALDGGTVTIRAAGNPGYHFLHWNDNNTDSVRTVEVHGNVTYTAYFASNSTEAIDDVNGSNIKVYAIDGSIVVEGRENRPVWVFDMYGRVVDNRRLPSGVYLVKVGTLPARKVVVIR